MYPNECEHEKEPDRCPICLRHKLLGVERERDALREALEPFAAAGQIVLQSVKADFTGTLEMKVPAKYLREASLAFGKADPEYTVKLGGRK